MKKLLLITSLFLFGCATEQDKQVEFNPDGTKCTLIYDGFQMNAYILEVDSTEYIIVRSNRGLAITSHKDLRYK